MRLLVLASGNVIHARRWCDWFVSRGHELLLATFEPSDTPPPYERRLNGLPGPGWLRYPSALVQLNRLIRDFQPDLVNAHYLPGYGFLAALSQNARPLILSVWGSDILLNPFRSRLHLARAGFVLNRCSLVSCDSPLLTTTLVKLGMARNGIIEEPMGIDPSLFRPAEPPSDNVPPRIICSRRHEPLYDLETLLEALRLLQKDGVPFRATLAGEGSRNRALREKCVKLGLECQVEFTGVLKQAELADQLRTSDIYVSASRSDSTSVSLLEAMASGTLPVVSDIPGNRDWITHEQNGLLFPPGDRVRLAACLNQALRDSQLRANSREINAGIIRERAVWDSNMRRVEKELLELAGHLR